MKIDQKKTAIFLVLLVDFLIIFMIFDTLLEENDQVSAKTINDIALSKNNLLTITETSKIVDKSIKEEERKALIVYDNMTLKELSVKLEKSMNSNLKGKGELFASYSIELGLDPYLALAVVLHETGCSYNCSNLVKNNNNIGGLKGSNGKYLKFNSIDEGIKGYLDILYKNYYSKGLTTPELMNKRYAESKSWSSKINWYIEKIKAK